jgi:hypothetical protein
MPPTGQFDPKPQPKHPLQPRAGVSSPSDAMSKLSSALSTSTRRVNGVEDEEGVVFMAERTSELSSLVDDMTVAMPTRARRRARSETRFIVEAARVKAAVRFGAMGYFPELRDDNYCNEFFKQSDRSYSVVGALRAAATRTPSPPPG